MNIYHATKSSKMMKKKMAREQKEERDRERGEHAESYYKSLTLKVDRWTRKVQIVSLCEVLYVWVEYHQNLVVCLRTSLLPWNVVHGKPYSHILCAIFIYFSHNFLDPYSLQHFSICCTFFVQLVFFSFTETFNNSLFISKRTTVRTWEEWSRTH